MTARLRIEVRAVADLAPGEAFASGLLVGRSNLDPFEFKPRVVSVGPDPAWPGWVRIRTDEGDTISMLADTPVFVPAGEVAS